MGDQKSSIVLIKKLFRAIGILPLTDGNQKWIDTVWTRICFCACFLLPTSSLHFIVSEPIPLLDKLEPLLFLTANIHIVCNQAILILNRETLVKLFDDIEGLYTKLHVYEDNAAILDKWAKRGKSQGYFFISIYNVYTLGTCLISISQMLIFHDYKLPYSISTLFIPKRFIALCWMFQVLTMFVATNVMPIQMSFICIIGTSIAGGMEVLKKELCLRSTESDNKERQLFTYKLHSQIINLTDRFNKLYGFSLAFLTTLCSIQCCVTTYPLATAKFKIQDIVLFSATNVFPVAICETGNAVFSESYNVFLATYNNYWYTENDKSRKELNIMMLVARRPLHLHFRRVVSFTYETYVTILQTAYSYMAMLRTMDIS